MGCLRAQIEYLTLVIITSMSLYKYFSVKDKLPRPTEPFSLSLSSSAIVAGNREVTKVMESEKEKTTKNGTKNCKVNT